MKRLTLLTSAAALLLAGGCKDKPLPTAPRVAAVKVATSPTASGRTTICRTYKRKLAAVQLRLAREPENAVLRVQATSLRNATADACN